MIFFSLKIFRQTSVFCAIYNQTQHIAQSAQEQCCHLNAKISSTNGRKADQKQKFQSPSLSLKMTIRGVDFEEDQSRMSRLLLHCRIMV